ncbi:hypothetical protein R52603_05238 [Paraburkholderia saeva]|uniref:Uncharacterized protein n=1 Tax=Paraburkholderia saeva TaxID=2777537 RepID=A0A9N8RXS8_9BURK|nr:hypothetical protein [Paraburkholderia saeva]CAG4900197.1 hypothetical protein LMG31841_02844 [Paraburkholderia saeva]CAG4924160.1 hypothetical protein R52603_05238 [Paraburkholderia saeva]CAG4925204.1 hypothetical protein R70241_05340 [Paraburkholderia saeva]
MLLRHSIRFVSLGVAASLAASAVFAASGGQPLVLDSQHGISDGQSGTVLQTAPLSHAPIVQAQPIAAPTELSTNSSTPIFVAPYVDVQAGGGSPHPHPHPQPHPQPHPMPHPQPVPAQ